MTILKKLFTKLLIAVFAVAMMGNVSQLSAMDQAPQIGIDHIQPEPVFQIYKLLLLDDTLPKEIVKTVVQLISRDCLSRFDNVEFTSIDSFVILMLRLTREYDVHLLAAYLKDVGLLGWINQDFYNLNAFNNMCMNGHLQSLQTMLLIADKELVNFLKMPSWHEQTSLHVVVFNIPYVEVGFAMLDSCIQALTAYAQDCPHKCSEVLDLLGVKDRDGKTVLDLVKKDKKSYACKRLKSLKKDMEKICSLEQKKASNKSKKDDEKCVVQ